jgi:outer membrane receptor protein involved in Fe transport
VRWLDTAFCDTAPSLGTALRKSSILIDHSFFIQDDWKFSQKLTLNLGMRYELDLPPYDTRGSNPTFDPALYRPRQLVINGVPQGPPIGGFVQPKNVIAQYDLPELPKVGKRVLRSIDPNNFGPRIGFAYSPLDSGRLVVRGGYGIFYSRPSSIYINFNVPPAYLIGIRSNSPPPFADRYFPAPSQDRFPTFVPGGRNDMLTLAEPENPS